MNRIDELLVHLFNWILSVSAMGAVTVVLILLTQLILNKRIKPRWHYLMWLLLVVRLLLPWGIESELSIYNWISYPHTIHDNPTAQIVTHGEAVVGESATANIFYRYALYIWLLGTGIFGAYTFVINRKFALKITKETTPLTDIGVLQLFSHCQTLMSVRKPVTLVVSNKRTSPTLFGFWNTRLVMPQAVLDSLQQEQLRHIFLHELAHCKRNDIGMNWLMQILLIIHWFNPILWYAYHRMREDQEIASDALALTYLEPEKRSDYGYTLIQLLEKHALPVRVPGNVNVSGGKSQLKRRIIMIKYFQSHSYRWSFVGFAAILLISGCSLTNAKIDQSPAQMSNASASDQKTVATSDPSSPKPDKNSALDAAVGTKSSASSEPASSKSESINAETTPAATAAPAQIRKTQETTVPVSEPAPGNTAVQEPKPVPQEAVVPVSEPRPQNTAVQEPKPVPQESAVTAPKPVPQAAP